MRVNFSHCQKHDYYYTDTCPRCDAYALYGRENPRLWQDASATFTPLEKVPANSATLAIETPQKGLSAQASAKPKRSKKAKAKEAPRKPSKHEIDFRREWPKTGLVMPVAEYRFHPVRQWRFDFAWPDESIKLAIELDGGTWSGGRHNTGSGFAGDCEKFNAATELGWRVLRYTKVNDDMILQIMRVLGE